MGGGGLGGFEALALYPNGIIIGWTLPVICVDQLSVHSPACEKLSSISKMSVRMDI